MQKRRTEATHKIDIPAIQAIPGRARVKVGTRLRGLQGILIEAEAADKRVGSQGYWTLQQKDLGLFKYVNYLF